MFCKSEFRVESKGKISYYRKPTLSVAIRRFDFDDDKLNQKCVFCQFQKINNGTHFTVDF